MKYKLKRMANCIEGNEIIESNKRVAKQIRYACFLIEDVEKGSFSLCEKEMKCFEDKWGQLTMDDSRKHLKFYFPKAKSPAEQKEAREEFTALRALQDKTYRDRKKRLFRHLDRYMEGWWD